MSGTSNLEYIFNPKSVAIAGVSTNTATWNVGQRYLKLLLDFGFRDRIYALNPKGGEIFGVKVYANVNDIPDSVDYVICCIPAALVPQLIRDCQVKGVKAIQLFTAGFSETGTEEGKRLEKEIRNLADQGGVRLIGPNCAGVYCPQGNLTIAEGFPEESGPVAFAGQSGGNSFHFVRAAAQRGVRFSKVVSYGNACDVNECDLIEYFATDSDTKIIAAYIEGVKDGKRFYRVLKQVAKTKPVIILKGGSTEAGARAAAGHTGALATSAAIWDGLCQQVGAISVHSIEELVDAVVTFLYLPPPRGRRVGVIGIGGGSTVLATDDCTSAGFFAPRFPTEIQEKIRSLLVDDSGTFLSNPVDLSAPAFDPGVFRGTFKIVDNYEEIDFLIAHVPLGILQLPSSLPEKDVVFVFTDEVVRAGRELTKPIAAVIHAPTSIEDWQAIFECQRRCCDAGLPVYGSIGNAARAIDRFMRYRLKLGGG